MTRVFVGNLPIDIKEREIDDLFYKLVFLKFIYWLIIIIYIIYLYSVVLYFKLDMDELEISI